MSKTIVVIDAGHGYKPAPSGGVVFDPGAIGYLGQAQHREADIAAQYANSIAYMLRTHYPAIETHLLTATREQPLSLQQRRRYEPSAAAFVSVHLNAAESRNAHGFETWYSREHSVELARAVHAALQRALTGRLDRGVKQKGLTVCQREQPSVLLELGFISNASDLEYLLLRETRARVAREIAKAVAEFAGVG
jgi:N-acetylmuramoyl-L-alanine amidase